MQTNVNDITINIHDESLCLMPERAIYWERTGTLFIADTHFGKTKTKYLPESLYGTTADLERLTQALARTNAMRLIILGDLIHHKKRHHEPTLQAISQWRKQHADLKIILVRGNHDRKAGDPPSEWHITCVDGPTPGPNFVLEHEPDEPPQAGAYALAGHLHPAIGTDKKSALRCFWFKENVGILPAFGSYIRKVPVTPGKNDQVYVIHEPSVSRIES